jgi:hypothetical protein
MERMRVYEEWFLKEILQVGSSRTLVVTQSEAVRPNYRDTVAPSVKVILLFTHTHLHLAITTYSRHGTNGGYRLFAVLPKWLCQVC